MLNFGGHAKCDDQSFHAVQLFTVIIKSAPSVADGNLKQCQQVYDNILVTSDARRSHVMRDVCNAVVDHGRCGQLSDFLESKHVSATFAQLLVGESGL